MSRGGNDYDDDGENFPNEWAFWERRSRQVMAGKPMQKALTELREALLALPDKRIISNALSTVGKAEPRKSAWSGQLDAEHADLIREQGEGVCIVGAFVWHKRVKAGADPAKVLSDLPLVPDYDGEGHLTIEYGRQAGLSWTLADILMRQNDDAFEMLTPEQRYTAFLRWIDEQLDKHAAKAVTA